MAKLPEVKYRYTHNTPEDRLIQPEMMGLSACGPFPETLTAARLQMNATQRGQALKIKEPQLPIFRVGLEEELAESSYQITMPEDGYVDAIIHLHGNKYQSENGAQSPEILVIFRSAEDRNRYFCVTITPMSIRSKKFGFSYVKTQLCESLRVDPNHVIPKDAVLAQSGAVIDGEYTNGNNARVVLASHPSVAEDGLLVNQDYLKRCGYEYITVVSESYGDDQFFLDIYGDPEKGIVKMFPDIGEKVRDDGVVLAVRSTDWENLAPIERSAQWLRRISTTDKVHKAYPGATVIDVRVTCNNKSVFEGNSKMEAQLLRYTNSHRQFHSEVYNWYSRKNKEHIQLSPQLNSYITAALANDMDNRRGCPIAYRYKNAPIDRYFVTITLCAPMVPHLGSKFAGMYGDKGVVCTSRRAEDMPCDERGRRIDIVTCMIPTFNRNIIGRRLEFELSGAAEKGMELIQDKVGIDPATMSSRMLRKKLEHVAPHVITEAAEIVWDFWSICSPLLIEKYENGEVEWDPHEIVEMYIQEPIGYLSDPRSPARIRNIVKNFKKDGRFKPYQSKLVFTTNKGEKIITKEKHPSALMHMIMLEKIGRDNSACAGAATNRNGMPARPAHDNSIISSNPMRGLGEDETGQTTANTGIPQYNEEGQITGIQKDGRIIADYILSNSDIDLHMKIAKRLILADNPSGIEMILSRQEYDNAKHYPRDLTGTVFRLGGLEVKREG